METVKDQRGDRLGPILACLTPGLSPSAGQTDKQSLGRNALSSVTFASIATRSLVFLIDPLYAAHANQNLRGREPEKIKRAASGDRLWPIHATHPWKRRAARVISAKNCFPSALLACLSLFAKAP